MEPLITKTENYSYSFYRKLIENIKQTKDKQCPDNEEANRVSTTCYKEPFIASFLPAPTRILYDCSVDS